MAVGAFGAERDDDVRLDAAQVSRDLADRFGRVDLVERAVRIAEEADLAETQLPRGRPQLGLARLPTTSGPGDSLASPNRPRSPRVAVTR